MSDDAHTYQVHAEVPQEQVTHTDVANAIDEKLIEQHAAQSLNANDIEREDKQEPESNEESAQNDEFSSKFAALSRKEKAIREREREIEQKIAQFEERMASFEKPAVEEPAKEPEIPLEYRLKKNPLQTLEELGLSYEDLTKMVLNDGQLPADMQMKLMREELENDYRSKFEELETKLTEKEKAEEEAKYNETITQFKSDINEFVDGSENYELIQQSEAYDLVYDVIEQYYEENQRILDTKEAADQVEEYLEEEYGKILEKSKKLGARKLSAEQPQASKPAGQSPTLSNSQSVSGAQQRADRLLSREESLAALAPLIKWED